MKGCDYSWDRPNMGALRAAGIGFVCRYLSYDRTGKNLTANEANALRANGLAIVSNWEWGERDAAAGYNLGVQHARDANAQHLACGGPNNAPIYFSVDYDAQPVDYNGIARYFDGVAAVIGVNRTGVYGGYPIVSQLWATGRVRFIWQTTAWSGGRTHPNRSIYQYQYNILIGGGRVDIDEAYGSNYGQWGGVNPSGGESNVNQPIEIGLTDMATPFRFMGQDSQDRAPAYYALTDRINRLFRA